MILYCDNGLYTPLLLEVQAAARTQQTVAHMQRVHPSLTSFSASPHPLSCSRSFTLPPLLLSYPP